MIQTFFDFPVYFKFFIGLFALVNPVGIIPVFISMTSYQTAAARNKTKEGANKQVISSQADSLIKISRIWAD
ncbi:MarC family protein, partial [Escherichia coli]